MTPAPTPETPDNPPRPETEPESVEACAAALAESRDPGGDPALLRRALEGLLFATDRPLSAAELGRFLGVKDQERVVGAVEELRRDLEAAGGGYHLLAVAEGWQMATRPELSPYLRRLFSERATMRLSTAAQETLAIVAYKQPLTRAEIEEIRGVEVIAALETLLEKRLVRVAGRRETVGRPLMYGTTPEFLRHFGLRSLEDLPPLDQFAASEPEPSAEPVPAAEAAAADPAADPAPLEAPAPGEGAAPAPPKPDAPDEPSGPVWPQ